MITDSQLKDAICNNDIVFLDNNIDKYSINHRLKDEDNDTLLSYAISDPDTDVYKFFLNKNAKLDFVNDEGENILHSAIYSGKINRVKSVLNKKNIDGKSKDGITPLLLALNLEKEEIANYLIDSNASIECPDLDDNYPIHLASFFGIKSTVLKLMKKKVNLNVKTKKGNLPLALAVNNNHIEIINILYTEMYKT